MAIAGFNSDTTVAPTKVAATSAPEQAIDKLGPNTDKHRELLAHLLGLIDYSERSMTAFYSRWNVNEKKLQAYISLPDWEQTLKQLTKAGGPPQVTSITVPYSYATIWTIVTYLIHTFCGRKPIFQVSAYSAEKTKASSYMETLLQFNSDHTQMILRFIQWFLDAETYGVGATRCLWMEEKGKRVAWTPQSPGGLAAPNIKPQMIRQSITRTVYQGNEVKNIDPYMFFPDPRVPMCEVNRRGEFVFWRSFEGLHTLLKAEDAGSLKWVKQLKEMRQSANYRNTTAAGTSQRSLISAGTPTPGDITMNQDFLAGRFYQIDQGSVEIIPSQWGIGDSDVPEKWLFSIGNRAQIIQAQPLDYDHDRHPVAVIEPSSFGYGFGQPGTLDFLGPIQDTLSWFVNSHIHNVRVALNNMFIVDPSMVEMQDLKNPGPGKIIRLKRSAYGQDVRTIVQQLQVQDVTANHMTSMQMFLRMGDVLSAVNDNLRGIQEEGGRKTATEVRTSGEAGASRLAARARYISAQGMVDLASQMSLNNQQLLDMEFYLQVVGQEGLSEPIPIGPQMIAGDFTFPVNDGTLPIDRTALLGVWKEIWMAIMSNPLLAQKYDGGKIFEYIAELGGAKNVSQFRINSAPDGQLTDAAASGNAVPLGPTGAGTARGNPAAGGTITGNGGLPPGMAGAA